MFVFSVKTALVLAPHTDDAEFGCGATMARLAASGTRVVSVSFSAAEQSVPDHLPRDVLRGEVKRASALVGVAEEDCVVQDFQVRCFPENRQRLLDSMIALRKQYDPDLVLLPSQNDTHQDHHTVAVEGFRAFKRATMLGYEVPWNNLNFTTSTFVSLTEAHLAAKVAALQEYKSQQHRAYATDEFVRSQAIMRGTQIGTRYAEVFEVVRWVIN
jgi:N-acetylglucosamine malate deacetylase 1